MAEFLFALMVLAGWCVFAFGLLLVLGFVGHLASERRYRRMRAARAGWLPPSTFEQIVEPLRAEFEDLERAWRR